MIVSFDTSWHDTRADDRPTPDASAPIAFSGLALEIHSGDPIDPVEIIWQPSTLARSYLDPGDLYEIQEVIGQAIAHYESKRAQQERELDEFRKEARA